MSDNTTSVEVTTEGQQLWERFQGFLSQMLQGECEFVLAPSLEVEGKEVRVTRDVEAGPYGLDNAVGMCLFGLAHDIAAQFPQGGRVLFSSPAEWVWCAQSQFVEEPLRFFFERGDRGWYLNMATMVSGGEE